MFRRRCTVVTRADPLTVRLRRSLAVAGVALALVMATVSVFWSGASATAASSGPPILVNSNLLNPATQRLLERQLGEARRVAARYPTLRAALKDGFTQAAPYVPGIGAHYMKYSRIYLPFNVSAPSMLLFDGDAPSSRIVGLAYYVYDSQGPPAGFAGPLDHWHQHQHTCVGKTGAHFEGDDDAIECRGRGANAWMLHVWVVGNPRTPQVIFSPYCSLLS